MRQISFIVKKPIAINKNLLNSTSSFLLFRNGDSIDTQQITQEKEDVVEILWSQVTVDQFRNFNM